jgi:hypothetical protein
MAEPADDQYQVEQREDFDYTLFDEALEEVHQFAKKHGIDLRRRSTFYLIWEELHPGQRMDILITKDDNIKHREWLMRKISERLGVREKGVRKWLRVSSWGTGDDLRKKVVKLKRNKDAIDILQFIQNCEAEIERLEKQGAGIDLSAEPLRQMVAFFKEQLKQLSPEEQQALLLGNVVDADETEGTDE